MQVEYGGPEVQRTTASGETWRRVFDESRRPKLLFSDATEDLPAPPRFSGDRIVFLSTWRARACTCPLSSAFVQVRSLVASKQRPRQADSSQASGPARWRIPELAEQHLTWTLERSYWPCLRGQASEPNELASLLMRLWHSFHGLFARLCCSQAATTTDCLSGLRVSNFLIT